MVGCATTGSSPVTGVAYMVGCATTGSSPVMDVAYTVGCATMGGSPIIGVVYMVGCDMGVAYTIVDIVKGARATPPGLETNEPPSEPPRPVTGIMVAMTHKTLLSTRSRAS